MAFFDSLPHDEGQHQTDFGFFNEAHPFDLLEGDASIPESQDLSGSQLFRDSFSGLRSGQEPSHYQDTNGPSVPASQMVLPSESHAPSCSSPNTADSPMPPPQQPPKKLDEPDSSCRPRLTPEQTAVLEEYYSHTPRPTTQQKRQHAIKLGLTQEKVNVSNLGSKWRIFTHRAAELVPKPKSKVEAAEPHPPRVPNNTYPRARHGAVSRSCSAWPA